MIMRNLYYKVPTQRIIYLNDIYSMEMRVSRFVDDNISPVVGGDELDEDFNRHILPLKNP